MKRWDIPYPKFGSGPGLTRVAAIARRLGLDLAGFGRDGAVVVGSNGKGSTAAMTAALLAHGAGRGPVGLFTSPHLYRLNERLRIDDADIEDEALELHWGRVRDAAQAHLAGGEDRLGGFEFLFLVAASWFAARGCAHTVWEAGIGGRLDPVRLIAASRVALSALDLEHTELLGDSREAIAREKIDAAPAGARLFFGEACAPEYDAIAAHCVERGIVPAPVSTAAQLGTLKAPLSGGHQRGNAALALALVRDIAPLDPEAAARGLAATRWQGRLEIIAHDPLVVIDVGHTPQAIAAALEGFKALAGVGSAVLVCGASHDKRAAALIAPLAQAFDRIVCVAARHKGAPAAEIAAYAARANPAARISVAASTEAAHALALGQARSGNGAVYVAGGLFLAAEFAAVQRGLDPATLAFF